MFSEQTQPNESQPLSESTLRTQGLAQSGSSWYSDVEVTLLQESPVTLRVLRAAGIKCNARRKTRDRNEALALIALWGRVKFHLIRKSACEIDGAVDYRRLLVEPVFL